ncbi:MAG TPA: hypothetical protein PLM98_17765 [Thiolinea sp.]|nr:hypothetical protein [Thiolinea sp.]
MALEVERVLAEEAKERQIRTAENREKAENLVKEKIPEQERPEPQARDKAATIVGNTNARYEGARLAGLVVLTTDTNACEM